MYDFADIQTEEQLTALLSAPYPADIAAAAEWEGDLLVLGAGGKMGPTLVERAVLALQAAGRSHRVYAASRFSTDGAFEALARRGAHPIRADLLDEEDLTRLPDCPHVIFMAGMKFGSSGNEPLTWAMNTYLPGRVAERFARSQIVAFSTGNVYPFVNVDSGGADEDTPPAPVGEYAQSCLGRERIFQYASARQGTPTLLLRLNYAVEARYGVLLDIGLKVWNEEPVDLAMGHVNVIWQGDANSVCLRAFPLCQSPARVLNLTGPETLSVHWIARELGKRLGKAPDFTGQARSTALLNNARQCQELLGPPSVSITQLLDLTASWIRRCGRVLDRPTKFNVRDGAF